MIRLIDVKHGGASSSPSSPHAKHHTKSAEELRLQKELSELETGANISLIFPRGKDHLQNFNIRVAPDEGFYQGGRFLFSFSVPEGYPQEPPEVKCLTKVFHPSIDSEGHVDLGIVYEGWNSEQTIRKIVFSLNRLFLLPRTEDPLNHQAAKMLEEDPEAFKTAVQQSMQNQMAI